ncbi:MAG TPA: hypothetical protein VKM55_09230 [Candidatus Lokiarchaeia archaeon]|nr:hypothetical protein [Candidatus Lokiarchaeia archaeon]
MSDDNHDELNHDSIEKESRTNAGDEKFKQKSFDEELSHDFINGEEKYWDVTFDGEDPGVADDFVLNFVDCSFLVGEPLLKNDFLDDMILLVKKHDHYNIIGNIKEIVDDSGAIQTDKNIYAILGILKNGLRIGFLIGNLIENGQDLWHIAAIWPDEFADQVKINQDVFQNALFMFLDKPEDFARVDIIVPITKKMGRVNFSI